MIPTYAEWFARGPAVCDAECAEAMGWNLGTFGARPVWVRDHGVVMHDVDQWSPITDRNHAAMMVEKVAGNGLDSVLLFSTLLTESIDYSEAHCLSIGVACAAPSLIAYCAWRALKEAG